VLTHEQVVDLLWQGQIRPLLLKRFPGACEALDDALYALRTLQNCLEFRAAA
jgi:hypothetical protein